jgi:hypothetical protein
VTLHFPGKQRTDPYGTVSEEIAAPVSDGYIDDGLVPYPERIEISRPTWPEGRAADFQRLNRREWIDAVSQASGIGSVTASLGSAALRRGRLLTCGSSIGGGSST